MPNGSYALVVDNSPVIRKIVCSVLESEGWEVRSAENGLDALDVIDEEKPAIIFTDLIMPKIDGEKLSLIVRNTPSLQDVFLVILSGIAMEDDDNTRQMGADVCIAKGPAASMRKHIIASLEKFHTGERRSNAIEGMGGLYPREVTQELLVSKKHSEVIFANMTEGVVELNHQGRIVMANKAAVTLLEREEARVLGRRLTAMFDGEEQNEVEAWITGLKSPPDLTPLMFNYDNPVRIGERQMTMNLVPVAENEGVFIIGMFKDVSRRKQLELRQKQLEKELQRIQKIDAMSLMASGIAHDFNNLLTIISGNLEMSRFLTKERQVAELLEEAGKALGLTINLIRKFTTFSDNYLPQKEQIDLHQLLIDTLEHELEETEISYEIIDKSENSLINLDLALVQQVITNLTSNAKDAIEGQGAIKVEIERVDGVREASETGQPIPDGELIRVVFKDNGPGISSEIIDQVFDPYFSTKQKGAQKGMGLGLTIVHSIIKKHGGIVWVQSGKGSGCAVHLYFPVAVSPVSDPSFDFNSIKSARRVLVMDDDEMMRIVNQKMFEHCKCEVQVTRNGEEAMEVFLDAERQNNGFTLVLLDLMVDKGMGGLETAREILEINPSVNIIAISGDAGNDVILNYGKYGFIGALTKPFSIDTVEDVVRRFIDTPVSG